MAFRVYRRYTSGHIFIKKYPFVKKLSPKNTFCDFHVCTIAASFDKHALITITCISHGKEDKAMLWKRKLSQQ